MFNDSFNKSFMDSYIFQQNRRQYAFNKHSRKSKPQSSMDNPETQAILGTRQRTKTNKTNITLVSEWLNFKPIDNLHISDFDSQIMGFTGSMSLTDGQRVSFYAKFNAIINYLYWKLCLLWPELDFYSVRLLKQQYTDRHVISIGGPGWLNELGRWI